MNELGLSFEEAPAPGKHRGRRRAPADRRRNGKPGKQRRGGRSLVAFLVVLVLLGGLGFGGWLGVRWLQEQLDTPDYDGPGTGAVTVEVKPGQTAAEIANVLYEADVVESPQAFVNAANTNPLSVNIQPGFYEVPMRMSGEHAVEALLDLGNRVVVEVTIPEGWSTFRVFDRLSEETGIAVADFEAAAEDPEALGVPESWFRRDDGREVARTVEGFLFPATYEFPPDATAVQILEIMVGQFLTVAEELDFVDTVRNERNITAYEALVVASLAQAEAGIEEDLPKIARVAYNRVYLADMPLEFDVTANYWLEVQGEDPKHSGELTESELDDPDNPYNTRSRRGLPVGPINSPGRAALEGAMAPADGDWLFFVLIDDSGRSAFATTFADHQENVQRACQNGIPLC